MSRILSTLGGGGVSRPRGCLPREGVQVQAQGGGGPRPGGVCIRACTEADTPPQQTSTAAGGTHPTGMHSFNNIFTVVKQSFCFVVILQK